MTKKIGILGTEYEIIYGNPEEYPMLNDADGFTDTSTKRIYIDDMAGRDESRNCKGDLKAYQKQVLRHEALHAMIHESGLDICSGMAMSWATNEEMIDWFSIQSPKLFRVYGELGILE